MTTTALRQFALSTLLTVGLPFGARAVSDLEFFEQKIRPVLAEKCFECHSADSKSLKGNLLLDSREGFLKGGDTAPALVPGDPEKSPFIAALHYADPETAMPPKKAGGKLPENVIADFSAWVKAGAPWPESKTAKKNSKKFDLAQRRDEHWCWKAPVLHALPSVHRNDWPRTSIDAFVLAKLEAAKLSPTPEADRATLLRRVTFDLSGLPPSVADLNAFLNDKQPNALERVVDRLLASPQFGERWARHWMDLVRYAESRGHEFDPPIPNAWQYRDYLVRAFNADLPYNAFVKEAIAGDLLPARLQAGTGANESVLGTGFWFLGEEVHSPVDIRQDEVDRLDNRLDVMGKTFLGMTIACARCHDHKFDAISQKDYYGMMGVLVSSSQRLVRFETIEQERVAAYEIAKLSIETGPALLKLYAQALRPALERLPEALAEVRLQSAGKAASEALPEENKSQWREELTRAKASPTHPLKAFASAWLAPKPTPISAQNPTTTAPSPSPIIIADYTVSNATPFLQDGLAFGLTPAQTGAPLLGASFDKPLAGIVQQSSARRQDAWKDITAKGDLDPGALKDYPRSGQSLRTPEFTSGGGSLWYLVRGAGRAYAVVNSHLMIQGPLHGKTLTKWADAGRWEWVQHRLETYQGHRLHVELMPDGAGDFEVAMVVESETKPPLPEGFSGAQEAAALAAGGGDPVHALQRVLGETLSAMESDRLADAPALSSFANWMVRSLDLLCPPASSERNALSANARHTVERYQALCASFKRQSQVATAMFEGSGADEFLLKRGSPKTPMAPVPRRFLEAVSGPQALPLTEGSGRRELAELVASASNPLTSRVLVNRVWHHLFGKGIVPTVDNFGVLGQAPTHQELLDTLAVRFSSEMGWSLKTLLRELVLSSTYAMASVPADALAEEKDPENALLHRMNLKRLEGEAIRDSILAVSGRLDLTAGGPSVPVFMTAFMEGRGKSASGPLDGNGRRSVYISIKRNFLSPMMLAFDTPIPFNTMGRRNVSNVPAQSLVLMNDPFVVQQAGLWAARLPSNQPSEAKLRSMYETAFARTPLDEEIRDALAFIHDQATALGVSASDPKVWTDFAHVLFNAKEFIHIN
ncbi:MAG: PSD1 and planctomycete cytochrome C domain-containing protein [Verrucomicrobiota bacterium]